MFAKDRDLLVLEPGLLGQAVWATQTLARGSAEISSGQLTIDGVDFQALGIEVGMLALVGGVAMEIAALTSSERADVSLVRSSIEDPVRPPPDMTGVVGAVVTFGPQIALVHAQLLRMLGVEPGATTPGSATMHEDRIVNSGELVLLESLGALHLIFAAGAGVTGVSSPAWERSEQYRDRFRRERWASEARIDLDGDGVADATRRFNTMVLTRG